MQATFKSPDTIKQVVVKDVVGLTKVLENVELMQPIYRRFLRGKIVEATVKMEDHPDGVAVKGEQTKKWLYVEIRNDEGDTYEVALWKILRYADQYSTIYSELSKYIEVV